LFRVKAGAKVRGCLLQDVKQFRSFGSRSFEDKILDSVDSQDF